MQKGEMTKAQMRQNSMSLFRMKRNADNPYESLASAIVAVAADDYRTALQDNDEELLNSLERFFRSKWYKILTNIDADILLTLIRREYDGRLSIVHV